MPPKLRNNRENDENDLSHISEESKKIIKIMEIKFERAVSEILAKLDAKDKKIDELQCHLSIIKSENLELKSRIDDIENHIRKDVLLISGDSIPEFTTGENTSATVCQLIQEKLGEVIQPTAIISAFRVGKKTSAQLPDKRVILVKVRSVDIKDHLLRVARSVKPNRLFFNESLTPHRASIVHALRQAKKAHPNRISSCGSAGGRVFVWLRPPSGIGNNQRLFVDSKDKLVKIFSDIGYVNGEVISRIKF